MSIPHFLCLVYSWFPQNSHSSNALAHVSWVGGQHFDSVRLNLHLLGLESVYAYVSYFSYVLASFLHSHVHSPCFKRAVHALFYLVTIVTFTPHIHSSVRAFRDAFRTADPKVIIVFTACHDDFLPFLVWFLHMMEEASGVWSSRDRYPAGAEAASPDPRASPEKAVAPQSPATLSSMQKRHRPLAMTGDYYDLGG